MYRLLLYGCFLIFFISCKKGDSTKKILITGTLLQSSSNPVPVANYKLSFYQQAGNNNIPFPITSSSSTLDITTNSAGYFNCYFPLGKGSFLFIPTANSNVLSISGVKNNGIQLGWYGLPANDTNFVNMYLYKKVHKAIIQVTSTSTINAIDTFHITASTLAGNYTKTITGLSIPQNTTVIIDTITDVIFTNYLFQNRLYQNNILIQWKQSLSNSDGGFELAGDEDEKNYLFTFP